MWDWRRPEPEHTPHRGRAECTHACTRVRMDTHGNIPAPTARPAERPRDATSPHPRPGTETDSPANTNTETRRLKPCHTAHAHQENRGKHGARRTHACTRKHALSAKLTWNREGSAAHTVPPGAGHRDGTDVRHNTAPSSEKTWERHRLCNMRACTHTHTHTPCRLPGGPTALSPLHTRRWTRDDATEFICAGGRTPL